MKKSLTAALSVLTLIILFAFTGCTRTFMVMPQKKNLDFTVEGKFGKLVYSPVIDNRNELDRKGQEPGACNGGKTGITVLGDKNYRTPLLIEIDKHVKSSIYDTNLFSEINDMDSFAVNSDYKIKVNLDRFNVVLDEEKAVTTQACVGGIVGAAIAASIDVQATSDISLSAIVYKGSKEVWRKSVSKRVTKVDDYAKTETNAENAMGEAIGEASKELVTELAKFLSTNS